TNVVILTTLKDLDNAFFVEHLNFKEINSVSDNDNNEEILDDINLDKLNKFKFIKVSDNYIKDEIFDNLKLTIKKLFEKKNIHILNKPVSIKLVINIQFMSSKSDLCKTCEMIKMDIQYAMSYKKKLELTKNYLAHLSYTQKKHDYYNNNIVNAIEDNKHNQITVESH
ncbi:23984_t:CDS:2, partial [Cetraspora pellucida]